MSNTEVAIYSTPIAPSNMMEAMKLAEMMASAKLVPAALQKSPADCLLVIEQALRWGMSPFAAAQAVSVISGKLMFEGKLVAAVVNANGNLQERLSYDYSETGEDRTITVSGLVKGEKLSRTVQVKLKDAKTQNSMWVKQPDQQLAYHGVRVWARRHMPELMMGVYSPEEFEVIENGVIPTIEQTVTPPEPKTEQIDDTKSLTDAAKEFAKEIELSNCEDKLHPVIVRYSETMGKLVTSLPKWHQKLLILIERQRNSFNKPTDVHGDVMTGVV